MARGSGGGASRPTPQTGLFGGTFDPVHNTHLQIARAAADQFRLTKVLFIPAARPPHKAGGASASYEDRMRMLELACQADERFEVSRMEAPSATGEAEPSYSILTIERLLAQSAGPLSFIIGADAFAEITGWHRWEDVVAAVQFIVVTRPGAEYTVPPGAEVDDLKGIESSDSSTSVRAKLLRAEFDVPVPEAVIRYIREFGLYQSHVA